MRLDGTRLDLLSMAETGPDRSLLIGGRRHLGVGEDRVVISELGRSSEAGIGIGRPKAWVVLYCTPGGYDEHMSPIDKDGWLNLAALTRWHEYWLELTWERSVSVERSDLNGSAYRWVWPLPAKLREPR